jgi:hypothetical protein
VRRLVFAHSTTSATSSAAPSTLSRLLGLLVLIAAWPSEALAGDARRLELQVEGTCPTRELVASELGPLITDYELTEVDAEADASRRVRVEDWGTTYRISVGGAVREVRDERRGCLERARVAAVFVALNLPESRPDTPKEAAPAAPPAQPVATPEPAPAPSTARVLRLRAFAQLDAAPAADVRGNGAGAGVSLDWGRWLLSFEAAITTPTTPFQADGAATTFLLHRYPSALLLGYTSPIGLLDIGLQSGAAVDVLAFEGRDVPRPASALRLNLGVRLAGLVRVRAGRALAAELSPAVSWFPRAYSVRVEPTRVLASSPSWWIGASIGLSYRIWDE